ncbi:interferon lambda receptor 1 [Mixophyes fleayi]|uniref:interferon lambda receptor 1 n=1 Tax=Mixophyes fleayi TaxID=3061075 RepID=UPI003F4D967F
MSAKLEWILLLLGCIVGLISGVLHKPINLKVESRNFSLFLTWLPNPENPSNVTYKVGYKENASLRWRSVPTCTNVTAPECNLTCLLMENYTWEHMVRVRAVSHLLRRSPWVDLGNISYLFTVKPDPPILHIAQGESSVSITASVSVPLCVPEIIFLSHLKYSVEVVRDKALKQIIHKEQMNGSSITIKTDGFNGEYCFAAKTIYVMDSTKESRLSNPVCKTFTHKVEDHQQLLVGLTVTFAVIFVIFIVCIIYFIINKKAETPKALDFSCKNYRLEASNLPVLSLENDGLLENLITIYDKKDQALSVSPFLYSENNVSANEYPFSGCGYMQRHSMQDNLKNELQTGNSVRQEYMSSKGLSINSNSDKSSSGFNCENTSGSSTGKSMTLDKIQINDCTQERNIIWGEIQTLSSANLTEHHLFNNLGILDPNGLGNVPFDTLCIAGNNDQMESSDDESSNQPHTDSEDSLEESSIVSTECEKSDSYIASKVGKSQKNWSSGYEQRRYTSKRC